MIGSNFGSDVVDVEKQNGAPRQPHAYRGHLPTGGDVMSRDSLIGKR